MLKTIHPTIYNVLIYGACVHCVEPYTYSLCKIIYNTDILPVPTTSFTLNENMFIIHPSYSGGRIITLSCYITDKSKGAPA